MFSSTKRFYSQQTKIMHLVYLRLMLCDCFSTIMHIKASPDGSYDIWLNLPVATIFTCRIITKFYVNHMDDVGIHFEIDFGYQS